jgi:hypothetical protein
MYPDDRVLVGVIKRKRDLTTLQQEGWYRIPQARLKRGVHAEYVAFFLSGRVFKERSGGIHYYARRTGLELAYRRDLLPDEAEHPRAADVYYKVQIRELVPKDPPVLNPGRRTVSFIYTTWDRFVQARRIEDLYSRADYFVDRVYHALRSKGYRPERFWETERRSTGHGPGVRVLCEKGPVVALTDASADAFYLDDAQETDAILAEIIAEIAKQGGPLLINVPLD